MIRDFAKLVLQEDMTSFKTATANGKIDYVSQEPFFEGDEEQKAKELKRVFSAHADHQFLKSLIKVHWVRSEAEGFERLLRGSKKDEISTNGYLPDQRIFSHWGSVGMIVDGRVTLASNDMDDLYTGYSGEASEKFRQKTKNSGLPRRALTFNSWIAKSMILDKDSFESYTAPHNELVVDNWRVTGMLIPEADMKYVKDVLNNEPAALPFMKKLIQIAQRNNLKVFIFGDFEGIVPLKM